MAYAYRRYGLALTVFAARGANPIKVAMIRALGAEAVLAGDDFDQAKEAAVRFAAARAALLVEDGRQAEG